MATSPLLLSAIRGLLNAQHGSRMSSMNKLAIMVGDIRLVFIAPIAIILGILLSDLGLETAISVRVTDFLIAAVSALTSIVLAGGG